MAAPPRQAARSDEKHGATPGVAPAPRARGRGAAEAVPGGRSGRVVRLLKVLGPGLIAGAADDDPCGIGAYATAGAALGYATLWTALLTLPMMVVAQFVCAKVGLVSGMGLAGVLRRHYRRWLLYPAVAVPTVANTLNAGADLGAVAAGISLLTGGYWLAGRDTRWDPMRCQRAPGGARASSGGRRGGAEPARPGVCPTPGPLRPE